MEPGIPLRQKRSMCAAEGVVISGMILHPLWWVLGLDQVIWPAVAVVAGLLWISGLSQKGVRIRRDPLHAAMLSFLLVYFVSGLLMPRDDLAHWAPVFVRNFGNHLTAGILLAVVLGIAQKRESVNRLALAMVVMVGLSIVFAGVVAALAYADHPLQQPIQPLLAHSAPEPVAQSDLGSAWFNRVVLKEGQLFGTTVYRPVGFFLYGNLMAAAMLVTLPVGFYLMTVVRPLMRFFLGAGSVLAVMALITSTSRGALMAGIVAAAAYVACWLKPRARVALLVVLGAVVFVSVVGVKLGTGYEDVLGETSTMGVSYRASSNVARAMVYVETLRHWQERPLLGWGTQRVLSVRGAHMPPMGSHSTYLAILFKNGVLGLAAYLSIVFLVVREVWRARSALQFKRGRHDLLGLWFLGFVANLAHGFVADMNDDFSLLVLVWIFWGVLVQYARLARSGTVAPS